MALDLEKRSAKLTLSLEKKSIASIVAQVATVIDRSGSMSSLYADGTMQEYMNRLIPVGLRFDDNGQIDNWAFHDEAFETGPVTVANVEDFIKKTVMKIPSGGTSYAPVLKAVEAHYFTSPVPKAKGFLKSLFGSKDVTPALSTDPVYLIFQTDGENDDQRETNAVLAKLESRGIYIQFVGIGRERFSFIKDMADKYNNVGFMHIESLERTSDETLYDLLINDEFKTFLQTRFPNNIKEI